MDVFERLVIMTAPILLFMITYTVIHDYRVKNGAKKTGGLTPA